MRVAPPRPATTPQALPGHPQALTFVLTLCTPDPEGPGLARGKVNHLLTGRSFEFDGGAELRLGLARLLDELRQPPAR